MEITNYEWLVILALLVHLSLSHHRDYACLTSASEVPAGDRVFFNGRWVSKFLRADGSCSNSFTLSHLDDFALGGALLGGVRRPDDRLETFTLGDDL